MAEVGQLRASLSANSAAFASDMQKARDAVRNNATGMEQAMLKVQDAFAGTISAINKMGGYAAAAAAGGMAVFVKKQIDIADEMGKLAAKTGTTTEFLSVMGLVASQSGTSLEVIGKSIQKLSKNMDDASKGTGEAKNAFIDLGIAVKDSSGVLRPANDVMLDIANKFAGMEDGANKTALAMQLFGKSGTELIPVLNMGAAGIKELQQKARELGLEISTKTALEAAFLNDQLDILTQSAVGVGRGIALDLIPWLNESIDAIKKAKDESGTLMAAWAALGAVGSALFVKSDLAKATEEVDRLQKLVDGARKKLAEGSAPIPFTDKRVIFNAEAMATLRKNEARWTDELAAAKKRLAQVDGTDAGDAALKKQQEEAEARRKNTEAMIAQAEARLRNAQLSAQAALDEKKRIAELEAEEKAAAEENDRLNARFETLKKQYASETELALMAYSERAAAIQELEDANIGTEAEREELRLQVAQEFADRMAAIDMKAAQDKIAREEDLANTLQAVRQTSFNQGVALLQKFASKNKAIAAVLIALQTAKAVKDIQIQAAAASAQVLAYGQVEAAAHSALFNYPAAAAALARASASAAAIQAAAALSSGLAIASGAVDFARLGSSSAGGISPQPAVNISSNPINPATNNEIVPQTQTRELRVVVEGDGPHSQSMRKLLEDLAATAEDMGGINKLVIA